jgi:phenylacetate-CoA ligase
MSLSKTLKPTVLMSTPSLALRIAKKFKDTSLDIAKNNIRLLISTGEDVPLGLRNELESLYNAELSATYASSEAVLGVECGEHNGYHYWADKLLIEVLDPETGEPLGENKVGEIAITPLFGEVMPLIRYKLGDLVEISWDKCGCGLEYPRIWFKGRKKNTFVLQSGINVFHYQIKEAIDTLPFKAYSYRVILEDGKEGQDNVTLILETKEGKDPKNKRIAQERLKSLSIDFKDGISQNFVDFEVELMTSEEFRKMEKSKKQKVFIIDKRRYKL